MVFFLATRPFPLTSGQSNLDCRRPEYQPSKERELFLKDATFRRMSEECCATCMCRSCRSFPVGQLGEQGLGLQHLLLAVARPPPELTVRLPLVSQHSCCRSSCPDFKVPFCFLSWVVRQFLVSMVYQRFPLPTDLFL